MCRADAVELIALQKNLKTAKGARVSPVCRRLMCTRHKVIEWRSDAVAAAPWSCALHWISTNFFSKVMGRMGHGKSQALKGEFKNGPAGPGGARSQ